MWRGLGSMAFTVHYSSPADRSIELASPDPTRYTTKMNACHNDAISTWLEDNV